MQLITIHLMIFVAVQQRWLVSKVNFLTCFVFADHWLKKKDNFFCYSSIFKQAISRYMENFWTSAHRKLVRCLIIDWATGDQPDGRAKATITRGYYQNSQYINDFIACIFNQASAVDARAYIVVVKKHDRHKCTLIIEIKKKQRHN